MEVSDRSFIPFKLILDDAASMGRRVRCKWRLWSRAPELLSCAHSRRSAVATNARGGPGLVPFHLNQATQHWYSTGSGSDRAPFGECVSVGARSLPLPVLYHRMRWAPGRYRSRYCTTACTNVAWFDLAYCKRGLC